MGYYLLVFVIGVLAPAVSSRHIQFYRKDYTYIEEYDAYYKLHWDVNGMSWNSAFTTCDNEGAKLFYPGADDEWMIVKNLTETLTETPNVTDIFVGLHDEFNLGEFITVDGHPTENSLMLENDVIHPVDLRRCVVMAIETGTFKRSYCNMLPDTPPTPFVCKKVDEEFCPTIDNGYKYVRETNKCYKVNDNAQTWQMAMQSCFMEGGLLAVVENRADVNPIRNLIQDNVMYYIGFKKMFVSDEFLTVKGAKYNSDYFKSWYRPEENDTRDCGVLMSDYNSQDRMEATWCSEKLPFICEMKVK